MITVTTKEYAKLLETCYRAKQPLFVMGGFGIGKSAIPRQIFTKIAKEISRTFVEWCDLTMDQKHNCIQNPEKYFVFADQRTSQMDTTSLQGIPNMTKTDLLENIPYSWTVYFTTARAAGVIFFDEINLAAPIVQSITYSAIWDRTISDRRLSPDVYVFAAGNRMSDKAHIFDMPAPLKDRFAEVEVQVDSDEWVKWAISNQVNPHLISFISWKPSNLYNVSVAKSEKPSTPRGVVRASRLMATTDIDSADAHQLISISCGETFATEFQAYVKCYKSVEWATLLGNPKSAKDLTLDQQYVVAGGLADLFKKKPDDVKQLDKILDVMASMREDFAILTVRFLREINRDALRKGALIELKRGPELADKYGNFILDGDL